ncbi:phosphopentomutase/phosphoglucosamine mutase [Halomicrobium urmianum]|uniref:phosphopentomutase/phosphoglucosamine mutase n=1 Tax=Halomicrobium urmianum TaxID=1586233 RepID=UPI001CD9D343|nr:phosphopentomutase/phosphoglucosamine mutase [Halomicrobium urmianum]
MDLFGTAGIRGDVGTEVTPDLALRVGRAVAADGDEFVVGGDGRQSTPALRSAVAAGLQSGGARVVDVGRVPTPTLAFASRGRRGVMVTASHNPPHDNGIKLFADGTEYDREAERRVEAAVEDDEAVPWDEWGADRTESPLPDYREAVADYAEEWGASPADLSVAVDCGNGMAGVATPQVLGRTGAHVQALEANVDGHFPARESKPTPETLSALREFVARSGADLGIGHDGDADRIVVLDGDGEVVHEDTVVAILAEAYTRASAAGDPVVVTTPNASARIDERVRAAGGRVERVRLGALHEGVASARAEGGAETEVVFAAEPWKHVHPAFGGWIDGVASAAVLMRLVAEQGLDSLRESVTERPYRKVSVDCPDEAKPAVMERLEARLPDQFPDASVDTEYGVRLELPDGSWTLVRPSGTEPYVRAYAESEDVDALVDTVVDAVERAVDDVV